MRIPVNRKDLKFMPDSSRVVARFFDNGEERTRQMIRRVLDLPPVIIKREVEHTLREFAGRHRNITEIFYRHCRRYQDLMAHMGIAYEDLTDRQRLLIGSYSTMEYSIESAALFNPSVVEDPDQSFLQEGEKRVIFSFRATGEGHLSSIVFRRGILDRHCNLLLGKVQNNVDMAIIGQKKSYDKGRFIQKLQEMQIPEQHSAVIMEKLPERFEYHHLKDLARNVLEDEAISADQRQAFEEITWLVDSYYDVEFHMDADLSERVLFPISPSESQGIEDARFVKFTEDDGSVMYYATYTAYNGHTIIPKLLSTEDFYSFRIMPVFGQGAQNKNFALFPNKVKGKYAMLARIDGVNNYLMYSDRITLWNNPQKIQEPKYPWEYTQIGNCGAPIRTEEGWLMISHGVGPMRRYCIGASLFDLDDPSREIGRLKEPLLTPLENEREGYVPNVVYSCGSLIHNDTLILPYAVSDYASSYATVAMEDLMHVLKRG